MKLLLGKEISLKIKAEIKNKIEQENLKPSLFVLVNQDDTSSLGYVSMLEKNANNLGIHFEKILMESKEDSYIQKIEELNVRNDVTAIMVTRPLFKGADENRILAHIASFKDVDVMNTRSLGEIFIGNDEIAPATAKAIIKMIEYYDIDVKGKDCLVIGRSISVGKPVSMMLLNKHGTVTIAHSRTTNLDEHIARADIIVCAVGKPHFLDAKKVKDGCVIIDAGIHYLDDGKVVGDVLPCEEKDCILSKVPGGVGTITTSVLLENVLKLYYKQRS